MARLRVESAGLSTMTAKNTTATMMKARAVATPESASRR